MHYVGLVQIAPQPSSESEDVLAPFSALPAESDFVLAKRLVLGGLIFVSLGLGFSLVLNVLALAH
ncbi:hypothetical protein SAMN06295879_0113 [Agreia bicolorata]|uniref:Uncharacterized protein n=1 Tax=Agreia bicolorata TaxID=110935 RepID=A0A1T4WQW9_9MICO|nr:hypothetical protein [Agreia bicolorata]KJC64280.1 hypothetical protein TZ00_07340 [Agreia bicolorata]SKA79716.1 hypothetical protein SAMN06295879_0113 [Agreia bicolorata]